MDHLWGRSVLFRREFGNRTTRETQHGHSYALRLSLSKIFFLSILRIFQDAQPSGARRRNCLGSHSIKQIGDFCETSLKLLYEANALDIKLSKRTHLRIRKFSRGRKISMTEVVILECRLTSKTGNFHLSYWLARLIVHCGRSFQVTFPAKSS